MSVGRDFLLIEDDDFDVKFIDRLTSRMKPRPRFDHFKTAIDALEWLRRCPAGHLPKFLVVDINMPKMDGFEFLRQLSEDRELAGLPVVLVTSSDAPHDRASAKELGIASYVVKSPDPNALLSAINGQMKPDTNPNRG